MHNQPKYSLIISTYNRGNRLNYFLQKISQLSNSVNFEVIIVNNRSNDDTQHVLSEFLDSTSLNLKIVFEEKPGLSNGRNCGINNSSGEILIFIDDDCYPESKFIEHWHTVFLDKTIDFGGGRIILFDQSDANVTIQTHEKYIYFKKHSYIKPGFIHGANMAIRRSALEAYGVFDTNLGAGTKVNAGEDTEILQRMSTNGCNGCYSPEPLIYHHHGRKAGSDITRLYNAYDIGRGAFFASALILHKFSMAVFINIARRLVAHVIKMRFGELNRELTGARIYIKLLKQSQSQKPGHREI